MVEPLEWIGAAASFLAVFLLSLFHIALGSFSKISISRFLEDRNKAARSQILEHYEALKLAVEFIRLVLLIVFMVYLFIIFPRLRPWPLWSFLIASGIYFVFLEGLPRFVCAFYKNQVLAIFLPSHKLIQLLAKPVLLMDHIRGKEKEDNEEREASEEEIDALIEEAEEEGIIEKEEGTLLKSVVEFGDTVVREIMTPRVSMACISTAADIQKLRDLVIKEKHSRIPVFKDRIDNIEGVVVAKDLLEYSGDEFKSNPITPLIRDVFFVPESMKVAELLKELQTRRQKIAVVVDEHGGVSGLVTMEDVMEEIVGEIQDEYDKEPARFIQKGPLDYIVLGDAEVEDLDELFGSEMEEDDFITVSGLITHHLGRLPVQGETVQIRDLSFEVLDVGQKKIKRLRIKKAPGETE